MACRPVGAKTLSKPMLPYCQLEPKEHISIISHAKFKSFHSKNPLENMVCEMASILSRPQYKMGGEIYWDIITLKGSIGHFRIVMNNQSALCIYCTIVLHGETRKWLSFCLNQHTHHTTVCRSNPSVCHWHQCSTKVSSHDPPGYDMNCWFWGVRRGNETGWVGYAWPPLSRLHSLYRYESRTLILYIHPHWDLINTLFLENYLLYFCTTMAI